LTAKSDAGAGFSVFKANCGRVFQVASWFARLSTDLAILFIGKIRFNGLILTKAIAGQYFDHLILLSRFAPAEKPNAN